MDFYTYAYLREDRTPYYVGKGKGNRIYSSQRGIKAPEDISRIIFLKKGLTEAEAFKHEIYMIHVLGRKDLGTGILRNRTDGGDGCSGRICSIQAKQKSSESNKGQKRPPSVCLNISKAKKGKPGRKLTDQEKLNLSNRMSGDGNVTKRPEVAEKISTAKKGKPGRRWTQEQKDNLSQKNKGKAKTKEHKQKLSEATKRYYENRRNQ